MAQDPILRGPSRQLALKPKLRNAGMKMWRKIQSCADTRGTWYPIKDPQRRNEEDPKLQSCGDPCGPRSNLAQTLAAQDLKAKAPQRRKPDAVQDELARTLAALMALSCPTIKLPGASVHARLASCATSACASVPLLYSSRFRGTRLCAARPPAFRRARVRDRQRCPQRRLVYRRSCPNNSSDPAKRWNANWQNSADRPGGTGLVATSAPIET